MTSEESFRERVEDELAALRPPPIGGIAGEALARGQRIRRRDRVFGMVGGTAAVAGVAAGAIALSGGFGSGGGPSSVAPGRAVVTAPTSGPTPASTPNPTPVPSTSTTTSSSTLPTRPSHAFPPTSSTSQPTTVIGTIPASWEPPATSGSPTHPKTADGQSAALILSQDLAKTGRGSASDFSGGAMPAGSNANATLTWSTSHGSTRFSASVNAGLDGHSLQSSCNPMYEVDYCAAGKLSDGTIVYVTHGTGEPANGPKTHSNAITIERPDQVQITVVEWSNGPLTDDQLYAIVSDPRWGLQLERSFVDQADQTIRPFQD